MLKNASVFLTIATIVYGGISLLGLTEFSLGNENAESIEEKPLSEGLPPVLPSDFIERESFVQYNDLIDHGGPPLGTIQWQWKDQTKDPRDLKREDVLYDRHYAKIPMGSHNRAQNYIKERRDVIGRTIWMYPVDTQIVHVFRYKTNDSSDPIFELRLIQRLPQAKGEPAPRWAFGVYVPGQTGKNLKLIYAESSERTVLPTLIETISGPVIVSGERIHPESCRGCHLNHSPANYQYLIPGLAHNENEKYAGPCGFVPLNEGTIKSDWACGFLKRSGNWPFQNENIKKLKEYCHL